MSWLASGLGRPATRRARDLQDGLWPPSSPVIMDSRSSASTKARPDPALPEPSCQNEALRHRTGWLLSRRGGVDIRLNRRGVHSETLVAEYDALVREVWRDR